jgi:hypothetical protein
MCKETNGWGENNVKGARERIWALQDCGPSMPERLSLIIKLVTS